MKSENGYFISEYLCAVCFGKIIKLVDILKFYDCKHQWKMDVFTKEEK